MFTLDSNEDQLEIKVESALGASPFNDVQIIRKDQQLGVRTDLEIIMKLEDIQILALHNLVLNASIPSSAGFLS